MYRQEIVFRSLSSDEKIQCGNSTMQLVKYMYPWTLCVKITVILPFLRETFLSFVLLARVGWGYFVKFLSRFYLVNVTLLVSFTGWAQIWPRNITCHIKDNNKNLLQARTSETSQSFRTATLDDYNTSNTSFFAFLRH